MNLTKKSMSIIVRSTDVVSAQDMSTDSTDRLIEDGIITDKYKLTDVGEKIKKKLVSRLEELKKGVPFEERKINEPELIKTAGDWVAGEYLKSRFITNWVLWTYAPGFKEGMKVGDIDPDKKREVYGRVRKYAGVVKPLKGIEVFPKTWKVLGNLDEYDLIIFADKDGNDVITINAMYYDFIMLRYPASKFYVHVGEHKPLVAKIANRKVLDGVIAIVAPAEIM